MKDCTIEQHQCLSLVLNSKPKLHWAARACLLLIMNGTVWMEASTIFQSASPVYCTVALTSYFFVELCWAFFLFNQFMSVLISAWALTQHIMSISAQSDPHYVKWCCSTILLMMSQQTRWPLWSCLSWHFMVQWKQSAVLKYKEEMCLCSCIDIHCREPPPHLFLKLCNSMSAVAILKIKFFPQMQPSFTQKGSFPGMF